MGLDLNFGDSRAIGKSRVTPKRFTPRRPSSRNRIGVDQARIDAEVALRFAALVDEPEPQEKLSRVERFMRRNAPDLAGAPMEEVLAAQARRTAHLTAKWPRPRIMALGLAAMIAWLHPMVGIRLAVCFLILFLVAAVAVGPERARDGSYFLVRRFLRLWKVELSLLSRIGKRFRQGDAGAADRMPGALTAEFAPQSRPDNS